MMAVERGASEREPVRTTSVCARSDAPTL